MNGWHKIDCRILSKLADDAIMPRTSQHLLQQLFPFHVVFDDNWTLQQMGSALHSVFGKWMATIQGSHIVDVFQIFMPLDTASTWSPEDGPSKLPCMLQSVMTDDRKAFIQLKGSWLRTEMPHGTGEKGTDTEPGPKAWLFLGQVFAESLSDLTAAGLVLSDLSFYGLSAEYCLLHEQYQEDVAELQGQVVRLEEKVQELQKREARAMLGLPKPSANEQAPGGGVSGQRDVGSDHAAPSQKDSRLNKKLSDPNLQPAVRGGAMVQRSFSELPMGCEQRLPSGCRVDLAILCSNASNQDSSPHLTSEGVPVELAMMRESDCEVEKSLLEMVMGRHAVPSHYPEVDIGVEEDDTYDVCDDFALLAVRSSIDSNTLGYGGRRVKDMERSRLSTIHSQCNTSDGNLDLSFSMAAGSSRRSRGILAASFPSATEISDGSRQWNSGRNLHESSLLEEPLDSEAGFAFEASRPPTVPPQAAAESMGTESSEGQETPQRVPALPLSASWNAAHAAVPGSDVAHKTRKSPWRWFSCLVGAQHASDAGVPDSYVPDSRSGLASHGISSGFQASKVRPEVVVDTLIVPAKEAADTGSAEVQPASSSLAPSSLMATGLLSGSGETATAETGTPVDEQQVVLQSDETKEAAERLQAELQEQAAAVLMKRPVEKVMRVLSNIDAWAFDSFQLAEVTDNRPLSTLAFALLKRSGVASSLRLDEKKLARFLICIEDGYRDNPYHSRTHAADVLRTLYAITTRGGLMHIMSSRNKSQRETLGVDVSQSLATHSIAGMGMASRLGPRESWMGAEAGTGAQRAQHLSSHDALTLLAVYLSAIIHDYDHRGLTNAFLIQDEDPLALLYNDTSPMENHHVAAAFAILREPSNNFMGHLSRKVRDVLRSHVIQMVLGTDMKQHFSTSSQFTTKMASVPLKETTHLKDTRSPLDDACSTADTSANRGIATRPAASVPAHRQSLGMRPVGPQTANRKLVAHHIRGALDVPANSMPIPRLLPSSVTPPVDEVPGSRASVMTVTGGLDCDRLEASRVASHSGSTASPSQLSRASSLLQVSNPESVGKAKMPRLADVSIDDELNMLVWKVALKCADLGHLASVENVHRKWVQLLEEEMFRQGDMEKARGYMVSPLMDRCKTGITMSQPGFFKVIVLPLYTSLASALPLAEPLLKQVMKNYSMWEEQSAVVGDL